MRKALLLFFILMSIKNNAQKYVRNSVQYTVFNYEQISLDNHQFHFNTGILDGHVVAFSSSIDVVGDTLEIKMFYDITELIFNIGNLNVYNNTISYNQVLPENINYIKMSTNVIMIEDNPPYNPITIENVYSQIFNVNNLNTKTINLEDYLSIHPNPTTGLIEFKNTYNAIKSINIYDNQGQLVKTFQEFDRNILNLEDLLNGLYLIEFVTDSSRFSKKIVKR